MRADAVLGRGENALAIVRVKAVGPCRERAAADVPFEDDVLRCARREPEAFVAKM